MKQVIIAYNKKVLKGRNALTQNEQSVLVEP